MALCSFGGVNDQCSSTSWAVHETGTIPLLSCDNDMTAWLKDKFKGSGASGARGRLGDTKDAGDSKDRIAIKEWELGPVPKLSPPKWRVS